MRGLVRILKASGVALGALALTATLLHWLWPVAPVDLMPYEDLTGSHKTLLQSREYAIVAGTPWATRAGEAMLLRGGRACDAAAASLLALNVTHGEAASFPGVAPVMYYDGRTRSIRSYIGVGTAPRAASIAAFRADGHETVPLMDIRAQLVPASPDVLFALLADCGVMSFGEIAAPAIQLAREGFPAHKIIIQNLDLPLYKRFGFSLILPYNRDVWLKGQWRRGLILHERLTFPDLAKSLAAMAGAERDVLAAGGTRAAGLAAARAHFYEGPLAQAIAEHHAEHGGWISRADLREYRGGWELPVSGGYGDYTLHSNGPWSQGLMAPMILQTLEGVDLQALGHNTPAYIHAVTQAIDLAMADRDAYVGDSSQSRAMLRRLLSKEYATERRAQMTPRAFGPAPRPGAAPGTAAHARVLATRFAFDRLDPTFGQDTSQITIVDRAGDAIVITPSDFPRTPMIPGTGLTLGNRMVQFRLEENSPNALAPGKRPRITPHAILVFKDQRLFLAFSTPGGDMQAQALVQTFLNIVVFGMDVQSAVSAPRFYTVAAPSSFAPHEARPGVVRLEADLFAASAAGLGALGYEPEENPRLDKDFGAVGAILVDDRGLLNSGADPREETLAAGR